MEIQMDLLKTLITEAKYFTSFDNYNFWIEDYTVTAEHGDTVDFDCQVCFTHRTDNENYGSFKVEFTGEFDYDEDGGTIGKADYDSIRVKPSEDPSEKGITHLIANGVAVKEFKPIIEKLVSNLAYTFADKNPYKFKDRADDIAAASNVDDRIDTMQQRDM